jgi:hypothetical protein
MKNVFIIFGLVLVSLVAACQKQRTPAVVTVNPTLATPTTSPLREELLWERSPEKFRQTWTSFTKDATYRMAQTKEVGGMPYHYSFANDVLVIVVDQRVTDNSRFRLAYFKAPANDRGDYRLYWVDHNFNLANSRLGNASSVLYIYEGGEPPTRLAPLEWDSTRRRYTCLAT